MWPPRHRDPALGRLGMVLFVLGLAALPMFLVLALHLPKSWWPKAVHGATTAAGFALAGLWSAGLAWRLRPPVSRLVTASGLLAASVAGLIALSHLPSRPTPPAFYALHGLALSTALASGVLSAGFVSTRTGPLRALALVGTVFSLVPVAVLLRWARWGWTGLALLAVVATTVLFLGSIFESLLGPAPQDTHPT